MPQNSGTQESFSLATSAKSSCTCKSVQVSSRKHVNPLENMWRTSVSTAEVESEKMCSRLRLLEIKRRSHFIYSITSTYLKRMLQKMKKKWTGYLDLLIAIYGIYITMLNIINSFRESNTIFSMGGMRYCYEKSYLNLFIWQASFYLIKWRSSNEQSEYFIPGKHTEYTPELSDTTRLKNGNKNLADNYRPVSLTRM